jgi:hypothetical protein
MKSVASRRKVPDQIGFRNNQPAPAQPRTPRARSCSMLIDPATPASRAR